MVRLRVTIHGKRTTPTGRFDMNGSVPLTRTITWVARESYTPWMKLSARIVSNTWNDACLLSSKTLLPTVIHWRRKRIVEGTYRLIDTL
jgi:hypothetical protein